MVTSDLSMLGVSPAKNKRCGGTQHSSVHSTSSSRTLVVATSPSSSDLTSPQTSSSSSGGTEANQSSQSQRDRARRQLAQLKQEMAINSKILTAAQRKACVARPELLKFMNWLMELRQEEKVSGVDPSQPDPVVEKMSVSKIEQCLLNPGDQWEQALSWGARKLCRNGYESRRIQAAMGHSLKSVREAYRRKRQSGQFFEKARAATGYEESTVRHLQHYYEMTQEAPWLLYYPMTLKVLTAQIPRLQSSAIVKDPYLNAQMDQGLLQPDCTLPAGSF